MAGVVVSDAVAIVCGNGANADRYEARNDALRSIARRRSLTKEDAAVLMDYLASAFGTGTPRQARLNYHDERNMNREEGSDPSI